MYNPWGLQESDTTEQLSLSLYSSYNPHPLISPPFQWQGYSMQLPKNKTKPKNSENSEFRFLPDSLLLLLFVLIFFFN